MFPNCGVFESLDSNALAMKCVVATGRGRSTDYANILDIREDWPRPEKTKGQLLLRVQACALAPGDVRTLSGYTNIVQNPESGGAYVPGGDVVGIVEEPDEETAKFKAGDCVIAQFDGVPSGGLGEFAAVSTRKCVLKPEGMSSIAAAASAVSPMVAMRLVNAWVKEGDRVLVLGATGGVGIHVIQLLKMRSVSYVAATARRVDVLKNYKIDRAIDYSQEDWWEIAEFQQNKFDVVLDLAAPGKEGEAWFNAKHILKTGFNGGRFITIVGPTPIFRLQTVLDILSLIRKILIDSYATKLTPWLPRYKWEQCLGKASSEEWQELFKLVADGDLTVVTDPAGPFPFTAKGVRDALMLQETRHAIGKIVVTVRND